MPGRPWQSIANRWESALPPNGDGFIAGDDADDTDDTVFGDGILNPGEIWQYAATGTAAAGQYGNVATVTADDTLDEEVTEQKQWGW